jgi:hypothetical protein
VEKEPHQDRQHDQRRERGNDLLTLLGLGWRHEILIGSGVAVLVAAGTPATLAAKRATATIPIVLVAVDDPVSIGVVESLGQPGGNATGLSLTTSEVITERLQLLRELVPPPSLRSQRRLQFEAAKTFSYVRATLAARTCPMYGTQTLLCRRWLNRDPSGA